MTEEVRTGTACCSSSAYMAGVKFWFDRDGRRMRQIIAEVPACCKCDRPVGELRVSADAPPEFTAEVWREMRRSRGDRFSCEFINGQLVPLGGKRPLNDIVPVGRTFVERAAEGLERIE